MTVCQHPLDEIDDPFHPSCYLLLLLIDASSTCTLPGQSDMVMKTYGLADEEAGSTAENKTHESHVGQCASTVLGQNKLFA